MTTKPQQQPQQEPPADELETTAIARVEERPIQKIESGTSALAQMTDAEFAHKLEGMTKGRARVKEVQRALMTEGVHYGFLPGQKGKDGAKAGLLKPGAEVLCELYHLVPEVEITKTYGDPANLTSPAISVAARALVHLGAIDGPVVAMGVGAANSWETKYRYRQAQRECPSCGAAAIMKSKYPPKGAPEGTPVGFYCNARANGCGAGFAHNDQRITAQEVGRVANPDAYDLENTLVKMAEKRAKVDGTISATGASDLFTQDVEDMKPTEAEADELAKAALGYGDEVATAQLQASGKHAPPTEAKPAAAAAQQQPAQQQPAIGGKPVSEKQIGLLLVLIGTKYGVKSKAEKDAVLSEKLGFPQGFAALTTAQASALIGKLQLMPDVATPGRAAATPAAGPHAALDDERTRTIYRENVHNAARDLEAAAGVLSLEADEETGIVYVIEPEALAALGYGPTVRLELGTLGVTELVKIGNALRLQISRVAVPR